MNKINDSPSFYYPLSVWFITVLVAPFVLLFAEGINSNVTPEDLSADFQLSLILMVCSVVFSIPSLFLFWFCSVEIKTMSISVWKKKMLLSVIGISFILVTFFFLDPDFIFRPDISSVVFLSSYAIALVAAICIVKIKAPVIDKS